jgi:sugar lactone lactonase YvrE
MIKRVFLILLFLWAAHNLAADIIPFDDAHWILAQARVQEFQGRTALMGFAILKDAAFENGVIEYDQYVSGERSYPGVMFRSQPDGSWERFYIRPHRSGQTAAALYQDVLQYVPSWNRVDSWQLYSGPGFTSGAVIPCNRWFHVRIVVSGTRMQVFIDDRPQAELDIPRLLHGQRKGGLMLNGPADGSAWYSNFSWRPEEQPEPGPERRRNEAGGFIRNWQVSQAFPLLKIDDSGPGLPVPLRTLEWRELQADQEGRLDVSRIQGRSGQPDTVFLRTLISVQGDELHPFRFGYSDHAILFLNGSKIFMGDSSYQGRDPSFLGIAGLFDTVYLPLRAGENELVVMLSELSGGWGFMMQDARYELRADGISALWCSAKALEFPESSAWDPKRQRIYVSCFDPFHPSIDRGLQVIRQFDAGGNDLGILLDGLFNPTGLAVSGDLLYAVEAGSLVEIDLAAGKIVRRIALPGARRANDVAGDGKGTLFVSDPASGTIFRIRKGQAEAWLSGPEVLRPNGLALQGGRLLFLSNGDGWLKAADLRSGQVTRLADVAGGIGDGLAVTPAGAILVSHNEGRLLRVDSSGKVTLLMDLTVTGRKIADFCLIPEKNMLVYPTFEDMRIAAENMGETKK